MKKATRIILLLVLTLCVALTCFGCRDEKTDSLGSMTFVVGTTTPSVYTVSLGDLGEGDGLFAVLDYLKEKEGLDYTVAGEGECRFLSKVGDLSASGSSYIYLYTTVEKDVDVSEYADTVVYDGKSIVSAGVGASSMTIEDGCTIYVGLYTYNG